MPVLDEADLLFTHPCHFVMGCVAIDGLPDTALPEIAFAGRSNVGKSSLINALTNRSGLAKASNTPGRTREINFFLLADCLRLVDLPGYGYARAGRKDVQRWNRLVEAYLQGRPNLARVCVLIDARHGLKSTDIPTLRLLDAAAVSYQIILTKSDKISTLQLSSCLESTHAMLKKHPAAHPKVLATSAEKKNGLSELRAELAGFASKIR